MWRLSRKLARAPVNAGSLYAAGQALAGNVHIGGKNGTRAMRHIGAEDTEEHKVIVHACHMQHAACRALMRELTTLS
jgi:hypothetical protein